MVHDESLCGDDDALVHEHEQLPNWVDDKAYGELLHVVYDGVPLV